MNGIDDMDFDTTYLLPVSGAVIGYFTNWIAIRMLFRPHNEMRLFGVKLPFTPGLIPKERKRLAASIGKAIEGHLLTEDALISRFTSPATLESVNAALDGYIDKIKKDERTLGEIIDELLSKDDLYKSKESLELFLTERLSSAISNEDAHKAIAALISDKTDELRQKTLREILPDKSVASLKEAAGDTLIKITGVIPGFLDSHPELDIKLNELTHKIIDENINALLSIFIDKNKVYESIKEGVIDYFSAPENQNSLTLKTWAFIDKSLDKPISGFMSALPDTFEDLIKEKLGEISFNAVGLALPDLIKLSIEKIYSFKIASISEKLEKGFEKVRPGILKLIEIIIKNGVSYISGHLDLGKIAEEEMNKMDVAEAERIIISVCGKELRIITLLGGVLGFIIGFVPIILRLAGI